MASGLTITYNKKVSAIDYSSDTVSVTTSDGSSYTANKIIVTVPLAILQNNEITFTPALPSTHTTAINKMGAGLMDKLVLEFSSVFWDENLDWINYVADGEVIWA